MEYDDRRQASSGGALRVSLFVFPLFFNLNMSAPLARLERAEQHGDVIATPSNGPKVEAIFPIFRNGANFNHFPDFAPSRKRKKSWTRGNICHTLSDFITNRQL